MKNLDIVKLRVTGNGTDSIRSLIAKSRGYMRIELDSIWAVMENKSSNQNDTSLLCPVIYFVKGEKPENMIAELPRGKQNAIHPALCRFQQRFSLWKL